MKIIDFDSDDFTVRINRDEAVTVLRNMLKDTGHSSSEIEDCICEVVERWGLELDVVADTLVLYGSEKTSLAAALSHSTVNNLK